MSKTYSLRQTQLLPTTLENAWDFFSNPVNLATITPAELRFKVISKHQGDKIYPGQIIEYKLRPLFGIPVYWMTEITHVEHLKYFTDEQRFGPYSFWHHQHHFEQTELGVMMTDIVHYRLPLGVVGKLAHGIFVQRNLQNIFDYRFKIVEGIFK